MKGFVIDEAPKFGIEINPNCQVELIKFGKENNLLLIIDDLLCDPELFVSYYAADKEFSTAEKSGNFYPGIRTPAPNFYIDSVFKLLSPMISRYFNLPGAYPNWISSDFSLLTLPPERLNTKQSIPHFDVLGPRQLAVLHYLCDEKQGGTSFYRHKQTDFEVINKERFEQYRNQIRAELTEYKPTGYVSSSTNYFEKIFTVPAKYNRLVVYQSQVLHSVQFDSPSLLNDVINGRLTVNTFINY
ncbi:hypothetical protein CWB96_08025 [Pseudoalteromonas citrea]|uniref:Uncharacterized protein n=1 Tax=Pseudoalteromonas citrea TaxID=43655 RepID=A0A5S3XQT0_9GAMM|nr:MULTISPECIES: DUF6445 family protein [Pseudoalteromonas]RJE73276.1 hypothetical protein BGP78_03165 [Pseudoalteromonas sp. MSK9-3]TMP41989.1 hypothetical protein CWB97_12830 [Pseudoalteromonas citrea]TMP59988.1 hypothetical protein CWB96_08025 [Pseudoalteromonas citrea]